MISKRQQVLSQRKHQTSVQWVQLYAVPLALSPGTESPVPPAEGRSVRHSCMWGLAFLTFPDQLVRLFSPQGDGCHISALTSNSRIREIWWVCFKSEALGPAWCTEMPGQRKTGAHGPSTVWSSGNLEIHCGYHKWSTVSLHCIYHIPQSMVSFHSKLLQQFPAPQFGCQWDGEHFPREEFSPTGK